MDHTKSFEMCELLQPASYANCSSSILIVAASILMLCRDDYE